MGLLDTLASLVLGVTKAKKSNVPKDGGLAKEQGFGFNDNPFPRHTPDHSIWRDDWLWSSGRFK